MANKVVETERIKCAASSFKPYKLSESERCKKGLELMTHKLSLKTHLDYLHSDTWGNSERISRNYQHYIIFIRETTWKAHQGFASRPLCVDGGYANGNSLMFLDIEGILDTTPLKSIIQASGKRGIDETSCRSCPRCYRTLQWTSY